jgi:hypothetical protein
MLKNLPVEVLNLVNYCRSNEKIAAPLSEKLRLVESARFVRVGLGYIGMLLRFRFMKYLYFD